MLAPRDHGLFARYLDGLATEAEAAELSQRLRADAEAAAAFAHACRLDASLGDHFRQEKGASEVSATLERLGAGRRTWRRVASIAAGIAAAILIALSSALWLRPARPPN